LRRCPARTRAAGGPRVAGVRMVVDGGARTATGCSRLHQTHGDSKSHGNASHLKTVSGPHIRSGWLRRTSGAYAHFSTPSNRSPRTNPASSPRYVNNSEPKNSATNPKSPTSKHSTKRSNENSPSATANRTAWATPEPQTPAKVGDIVTDLRCAQSRPSPPDQGKERENLSAPGRLPPGGLAAESFAAEIAPGGVAGFGSQLRDAAECVSFLRKRA
jgi:hypothetical protein